MLDGCRLFIVFLSCFPCFSNFRLKFPIINRPRYGRSSLPRWNSFRIPLGRRGRQYSTCPTKLLRRVFSLPSSLFTPNSELLTFQFLYSIPEFLDPELPFNKDFIKLLKLLVFFFKGGIDLGEFCGSFCYFIL